MIDITGYEHGKYIVRKESFWKIKIIERFVGSRYLTWWEVLLVHTRIKKARYMRLK